MLLIKLLNMKKSLILLFALFITVYTFSQNSLETTYDGGNGFYGVMFDIVALNDVTIDSFSIHVADVIIDETIDIYYKDGTFVGSELDLNAWTLLTTVTNVTSSGNNVPTALNLNLDQDILSGTTGAFYFFMTSGGIFQYTNSSDAVSTVFVEDSNIQLLVGSGGQIDTQTIIPSRVFNGTIFYTPNGLSISENELDTSLNLFPNPASNEVKLSNNQGKPLSKVIIYDSNGRVIKTIKSINNDSELLIDVSGFSSGIYLIKVFDENNSSIKKLIIN